ncbi:insulin-induced protein-domain-containing protein [Usnea florida]
MTEDFSSLLHPRPRRPYDLTPTSTNSSPSSPTTPSRDSSRIDADSILEGETSNSRNRSILNLTSSTLFGIYTPSVSGFDITRDQPSTPRHSIDDNKPPLVGAYERPQQQKSYSYQSHQSFLEYVLPLGLRAILLFSFGVAYGVIVSHLHDRQQMAPVQLEGVEQSSWRYLLAWGGVGVLLGGLLPWIDILWEEVSGVDKDVFALKNENSKPVSTREGQSPTPASRSGSGLGADWNPVVRSVGAFIGIAFAIRRLPWQSTSQVSLTLALVNPVLWYLVDRSKPGFLLSLLVGLAGTAIALGVNPEIVPSPAVPSPRAGAVNVSYPSGGYDGLISNESIGVGIWIASVLFCSSVCFGNIGRRLACAPTSRRRLDVST